MFKRTKMYAMGGGVKGRKYAASGGPFKKNTKYMSKGGPGNSRKNTKYMSKGGPGMKRSKYASGMGANKQTKYKAKGGAI